MKEEILRLTTALSLLNNNYDKEKIIILTKGLADSKHQKYIEDGLNANNKALIIRGIMGALSHYESMDK